MKKILIVEDEADLSAVIQTRIESVGHEVVSAANGKEALDLLKTQKPDLIISDFVMPVMDGYDFYRNLKKRKEFAKIPVMILTARGHMEEAFRIFGVDEFMAKPFDPKHLLSRVGILLEYSGQDV